MFSFIVLGITEMEICQKKETKNYYDIWKSNQEQDVAICNVLENYLLSELIFK